MFRIEEISVGHVKEMKESKRKYQFNRFVIVSFYGVLVNNAFPPNPFSKSAQQ